MTFEIHMGDCLDLLRPIPDGSIDAVVTDPPYGLSFMGKKWDYDVPSLEIWAECLRVLKPGGHLLAFAGTRTQHRMAVRIEDAGFEIRDMIAWVYGSGFPKSLDVSKAIDATILTGGSHSRNIKRTVETRPGEMRATATLPNNGIKSGERRGGKTNDNAATEFARQWQGWGTALKPALEPITVARKPLIGTVAKNVLAHGTGAINVDGCRVGMNADDAAYILERVGGFNSTRSIGGNGAYSGGEIMDRAASYDASKGRWPANLIHDGGEEPADLLGEAARFFYCAKASKKDRDDGLDHLNLVGPGRTCYDPQYHEGGGKLPPRTGNFHPTVKPTDLMRYLCRLVTPPGGTVLDPFMGSGSTGKAALLEGFCFVGMERDPDYFAIARARIEAASGRAEITKDKPQIDMFEDNV